MQASLKMNYIEDKLYQYLLMEDLSAAMQCDDKCQGVSDGESKSLEGIQEEMKAFLLPCNL